MPGNASVSVHPQPRLSVIRPDKFPDVDTFGRLPIVIAHGGTARAVGKGRTLAQRQQSALGEWVERSLLYSATSERNASVRELGSSCLSPRLLGLDLQHELPNFVVPYDPNREVGWLRVRSLGGEYRWLHHPGWNEVGFHRPTSNGAAVHRSRQAALGSAIAELLERHAFVAWWYRLGSSRPLAMDAFTSPWWTLVAWFADRGWELTAHLLPVFTPLPVVLAAAIKRATRTGSPQAGIVGLGTGAGGTDPVGDATSEAALEVVQAMESFALLRSAGKIITGDLANFLTPAGATAIESRLRSARPAEPHGREAWVACPITAAQSAEINIWISDRRSVEVADQGMHFVQVFSPDTLPFPSTGRGRRLDHSVLHEYLGRFGRNVTSVPPLPHPLG